MLKPGRKSLSFPPPWLELRLRYQTFIVESNTNYQRRSISAHDSRYAPLQSRVRNWVQPMVSQVVKYSVLMDLFGANSRRQGTKCAGLKTIRECLEESQLIFSTSFKNWSPISFVRKHVPWHLGFQPYSGHAKTIVHKQDSFLIIPTFLVYWYKLHKWETVVGDKCHEFFSQEPKNSSDCYAFPLQPLVALHH